MNALRQCASLPIAALAVLGCFWFVSGLRFTNHDDIYFEIVSLNTDLSWWQFADFVAQSHGRFVAYLNMPLVLAGTWIGAQPGGEWLVGAHVALIGLLIAVLLHRLAGPAFATFATFNIFAGFAFHYFFTAPPGYPLMGLMGATLFLLAAISLERAIRARKALPVLALLLSTASVLGHEYNIVIFTLPLLALIWLREPDARRRRWMTLAFGVCWLAFVVIFFAFRALTSVDEQGERTALSFQPGAALVTFCLLLGRAFLPSGLVLGIDMRQAPVPGMPALPSLLDWRWLMETLRADPVGYLVALATFAAAFVLLLPRSRLGRGTWVPLAGVAILLMVVPAGILSLSPTYQRIVRAGYVQGHNASAFAQVGILLLLAVLASEVGSRLSGAGRLLLSLPLAALAVATLSYNLATRDAMSANRQKWSAFTLLAEALPNAQVWAPDFFQVSMVSAIPATVFETPPYWSAFARYALGRHTSLSSPEAARSEGMAAASYSVSPDGHPFVILHEPERSVVLARAPAAFVVIRPSGRHEFAAEGWLCDGICRRELADGERVDPATDRLVALTAGPRRLLARLVLPRDGAFGAR